MNSEMKTDWVAALRSGDYAQGQGCLRHQKDNQPDVFCCLGVLADLIKTNEEWLIGERGAVYLAWGDTAHHNEKNYQNNELPPAMKLRAGIHREDCKKLIRMNDDNDNGLSFTQIANWIEENL
jgi:hypothetical protein